MASRAVSALWRRNSPALLNRCVRSYLWGTMYGTAHGIIVLHMRDDVSPATDPESHLLQVATSWEVGRRPEEFSPDAMAEMLARHPRLGFGASKTAGPPDLAVSRGRGRG